MRNIKYFLKSHFAELHYNEKLLEITSHTKEPLSSDYIDNEITPTTGLIFLTESAIAELLSDNMLPS